MITALQGKKIEILELLLKQAEDQLELRLQANCENITYEIRFYNVSCLHIGQLSMPAEIRGFELIDHRKDGWGRHAFYEIHDFEEDQIHFYCEAYGIERRD